jgi:hypothetical protein
MLRQLATTSDTNSLTRQLDAHTSHTLLHTPIRRPEDSSENEDWVVNIRKPKGSGAVANLVRRFFWLKVA